MTYYLLPRTPIHIYKFIDYLESENIPTPAISNSLASYLYEIKQKLDLIEKDFLDYSIKSYTLNLIIIENK
jgi:hypothetical protein